MCIIAPFERVSTNGTEIEHGMNGISDDVLSEFHEEFLYNDVIHNKTLTATQEPTITTTILSTTGPQTTTMLTTTTQGTTNNTPSYKLNNDGTLIISGSGTIPGNLLDKKRKDEITRIIIEYGITGIDSFAFYYSNIESITIPDSVSQIGDYAFSGCTMLKSIDIPNSVTEIGRKAFYECTNLETVTLPNNIETINAATFYNCVSLKSISIPDSVTNIAASAFTGCVSLESITLPFSLKTIGADAFKWCKKIDSITIPNTVTTIGSGAFMGCSKLKSITIPNPVSYIEPLTFHGCTCLESIRLPDSIISIGYASFGQCSNLNEINTPSSLTSVDEYAFSGCSSTSITLPKTTSTCITTQLTSTNTATTYPTTTTTILITTAYQKEEKIIKLPNKTEYCIGEMYDLEGGFIQSEVYLLQDSGETKIEESGPIEMCSPDIKVSTNYNQNVPGEYLINLTGDIPTLGCRNYPAAGSLSIHISFKVYVKSSIPSTTTASTTTTIPSTTTVATTTNAAFCPEDFYKDILNEQRPQYAQGYRFLDLDKDGKEELLICGAGNNIFAVYSIDIQNEKPINLFLTDPAIPSYTVFGNGVVRYFPSRNGAGGYYGYLYYSISNGKLIPIVGCLKTGDGYYKTTKEDLLIPPLSLDFSKWDEITNEEFSEDVIQESYNIKTEPFSPYMKSFVSYDGEQSFQKTNQEKQISVSGRYGYDELIQRYKELFDSPNLIPTLNSAQGTMYLNTDNYSYLLKEYSYTKPCFILRDLNGDGIYELATGCQEQDGSFKLFDLYTIYNNKIIHLAASGWRDSFSIGTKNEIIEGGSSGAADGVEISYTICNGKLKQINMLSVESGKYYSYNCFGTSAENKQEISREAYIEKSNTQFARNKNQEAILFKDWYPEMELEIKLGDVNNDGHINALDASSVLSYYSMVSTNQDDGYNEDQKIAADVNQDGQINAVDASCILSYYAYVSTTSDEIVSLEAFLKK